VASQRLASGKSRLTLPDSVLIEQIQPLTDVKRHAPSTHDEDPIPDMAVHMTVAYCKILENIVRRPQPLGEGKKVLNLKLVDWLPKIYSRDMQLVLGQKNYIDQVNPPILSILETQAALICTEILRRDLRPADIHSEGATNGQD